MSILLILYLMVGTFLAWGGIAYAESQSHRRGPDDRTSLILFLTFMMIVLFWPIVLVVGLIATRDRFK